MSNLSTATHFCFSCGREIRLSSTAAPSLICEICEARHGGRSDPAYVLRPRDGQPIGPLTREQVIVELKRGGVGAEDLISESGDRFDRLDHHPHFLSYFIPESEEAQELSAAQEEHSHKQASIQRDKLTAPIKRLARIAVMIGVPVGVFLAIKFLVPAEMKDALADRARAAYDDAASRVDKAIDEEAAVEQLRANTELPGQEMIAGLQAKWPEVTEGSSVLAERGWGGLLAGTRAAVTSAETDFEQAIARNADDPLALSGLAVAYTITSRGQGEKSQHSLTALERARLLGTDEGLVLRGQSGMAASSGAYVQGLESADACLKATPDDGYCLFYKGVAQLGMGGASKAEVSLSAAEAALPEAPAVPVQLALARLELGNFAAAIGPLETFAAANPNDADTLAMMAGIWLDMGDGAKALAYAAQAAALDAAQLEARAMQGTLLLHLKGDAGGALGVLKPLIPMERLRRIDNWRQIVVHASHAARMSGDTKTALEYAELALGGQNGNGPARLAQARARIDSGDKARAEEAFKAAELSDLSKLERARFLYAEGRYYLEQDRMSAAKDAFDDAVSEFADWGPATLALAMAHVSVDNPMQAADTLGRLYDKDLGRAARKGIVHDVWVDTIDPGTIARVMRPKFEADARLSVKLSQSVGILHAVRCLDGGGNCDAAINQLGAAIQSDDADIYSRAFLGRILMNRGDYRGALNHFERALARDDTKAILLALQGRCLYALGKTDEAAGVFKKAYNITENSPGVYFHHGEALKQVGDVEGAKEAYQRALRIDPDDVTSRGRLLALGG